MERIYYNSEKHHLRNMVDKIAEFAKQGEIAIDELLKYMYEKGIHRSLYNGIIDVYNGELTDEELKKEVDDYLKEKGINDLESYKTFLETEGGIKRKGHYLTVELSDKSVYTLRLADDEKRYVHVHPGRYSPQTFRVKSNTLKSVLLTEFFALARNMSYNIDMINEARKKLELSPVTEDSVSIYDMLKKFDHFVKKD